MKGMLNPGKGVDIDAEIDHWISKVDILKCLLHKPWPIFHARGHGAGVDKIEALREYPLGVAIFDEKLAIWWNPFNAQLGQINTLNIYWAVMGK